MYQLSSQHREAFERDGFVGPLPAFEPEQVAAVREHVLRWLHEPSSVYGVPTLRDRHLEDRVLFDLCSHPAIVERLAGLLGGPVVLWRTTCLRKTPGQGAFGWHQDGAFPGKAQKPALVPARNITCWVALTEATPENGGLRFLPGRRSGPLPADPEVGPSGPRFVLPGEDERDPVELRLAPGELVLFDQWTVHASWPNPSDRDRFGFVLRATTPDTRIYPDQSRDGHGLSLRRWRALLLKGQDAHGLNRLGAPPEGEFRRPARWRSWCARATHGLHEWRRRRRMKVEDRPERQHLDAKIRAKGATFEGSGDPHRR